MNRINLRNPKIAATVLLAFLFMGITTTPATANECSANARWISDSWQWHYPRETPNIRTGKRDLYCRNSDFGYLYTSDNRPGQYFVANSGFVRVTKFYPTTCEAVAEYCSRREPGSAESIAAGNTMSNKKPVYCNIGKSSFSYKPNIDYYVFRSYKLSENRRHYRRNYKIIGDYNNRSLQNVQKIRAEGKMEFIMKAPLRELCPHLKNNCNTAEPFVSDLCGRLNENAVFPSSAYTGQ